MSLFASFFCEIAFGCFSVELQGEKYVFVAAMFLWVQVWVILLNRYCPHRNCSSGQKVIDYLH